MCGIFGIASDPLPSHREVKAALDSIRHRGPDDEGYVLIRTNDGAALPLAGSDTHPEVKKRYGDMSTNHSADFNVVLANRRLSIIDLSARGHQPMSYSGGSLWITYNGEIFNYEELRRELTAKGYRFDSHSDTEVVLAAYEEWGPGCVTRFNGQWAFCIYDHTTRSLFCSRDRFGIKPFYYWFDGKTFAFASEIKTLLTLPFVTMRIKEDLLLDLIVFHMHHHTNDTICDGIHQVPPSHNITLTFPDLTLSTERYYSLPLNHEVSTYDHRQALRHADNIRELLVDAVRLRLIAEVPVGSCLSGGLDSSSIVAIINMLLEEHRTDSKNIGEMQKTFTASIDEPSLDETRFAEEMIRHTNVDGFFVSPSAEGLWKEADEFLHYHDNICKSTNIYAGWCVMRLASKHVKVVLNGQGSDELFGGYPRYEMTYLADMLKRGNLRSLYHFLAGQKSRYGNVRALHHLLMGGYLAAAPSFLKVFLFRQKNKLQWERLEGLFRENIPHKDSFNRMTQWTGSLNCQLWRDVTQGYLRQLLYSDDKNASAFSVENRVPFLDHRLADYVSSVPSVYKIHKGWSKWLLRLAMRELLPERILWRKDKIGFTTPSGKWSTSEHSPILPLIKRYGIKEYSTHYLWKFYIAHRLINLK